MRAIMSRKCSGRNAVPSEAPLSGTGKTVAHCVAGRALPRDSTSGRHGNKNEVKKWREKAHL
jgi:hypothetical protein